jgi:hypothetical protein
MQLSVYQRLQSEPSAAAGRCPGPSACSFPVSFHPAKWSQTKAPWWTQMIRIAGMQINSKPLNGFTSSTTIFQNSILIYSNLLDFKRHVDPRCGNFNPGRSSKFMMACTASSSMHSAGLCSTDGPKRQITKCFESTWTYVTYGCGIRRNITEI